MAIRDNHTTEGSTLVVHKFGRANVSTTFVPVAWGLKYQTPQVAAATKLRVKLGDVKDDAGGDGARAIVIQGIDDVGDLVSETILTAGTSAGANSVNDYIRIFRAYVSESGTYTSSTAGAHEADIIIENAAGSADWLTIDSTDFPRGQSEIACYTIPNGYTAYISYIKVATESTKPTTVVMFKRENILETAAPYSAGRMVIELGGLDGVTTFQPDIPYGPYPAGTDLVWMGKVTSGTSLVDIDFEILLVEE